MLKELIGAKQLEDNLPENEKEMANAARALFADMDTFRKSQEEQLGALQKDLGQLYTSESFSSTAAMQKSVNAADKKLSLDRISSAYLERMPELVKAHLDQTKLSDTDKEKFLTGFMSKFGNSAFVSAWQQMMAVESNWAQSAGDLYEFSLQHASQIVVTRDGIGIGNDAVREKFNAKLTWSEELRENYLAAAKKADEVRTAGLKSEGLTPADLQGIIKH
jgi:hypothetical protein